MYSVAWVICMQSMLICATFASTAEGESISANPGKSIFAKPATSRDACDGTPENHVCMVRKIHHKAVRKGEVAAKVWTKVYQVEQDIKAAKDVCIMSKPRNMPSTTQRHPVEGDWVRPKSVLTKDKKRVCLPLRWKKYEDDATCGWQMQTDDKAKVLVTDGKGMFRLADPRNARESAMESWENWQYDNSVLVGMMEKITNLKADCEKVVFSLYTSQTDINDTSEQIKDLHDEEKSVGMINAEMKSQELKKFKELQEKIDIANDRLGQLNTLKERYERTCR